MCSSARESWSTQSLSPVVMGLLTTAVTHSSVPPGSNDTDPSTWLNRATRVGGSSSSAAARCGTQNNANNVSASKLTNFSACFLIIRFSPEPDAAGLFFPDRASVFLIGSGYLGADTQSMNCMRGLNLSG